MQGKGTGADVARHLGRQVCRSPVKSIRPLLAAAGQAEYTTGSAHQKSQTSSRRWTSSPRRQQNQLFYHRFTVPRVERMCLRRRMAGYIELVFLGSQCPALVVITVGDFSRLVA